jgi:uncharacterized membrane protein
MGQSRTAASHGHVHEFATELKLDAAAYRRTIELAQLSPSRDCWLQYFDRFLTAVGSLLIVAGVTAFFAWNWAGLDPMIKFGLIQIGIMGCVVVSWRLGIDSVGGRSSLFAAAFLVGVLLAVFGQVYQTGADPYGLFLGWAVLILPLVWIGRQAGLWLLFLLLVNLGVIMYWTQVLHPPEGWWQLAQLLGPVVWLGTTITNSTLASYLFALNALALLAWEYAGEQGLSWCQGRLFPRLTAFLALSTVLIPTVLMVFIASLDGNPALTVISPLLYLWASAACLYYYQRRKLDLLILTQCLFGAIMVVMALSIRFMFEGFESALLLAFLLVAQTAAAAYWLRGVARRWEDAA